MQATTDIADAVERAFVAPEWREGQRQSTIALARAIRDNSVVALNAPTGAGKSIMLYTAVQANGLAAWYATPLNTLVDQIGNDPHLEHVTTIKGKNNYTCEHPEGEKEPVDEALCHREAGFECDRQNDCEYYVRKERAAMHPFTVTNMSFLMSQACLPPDMRSFEQRPVLVVDECQKLGDFAVDFSTVNLAYGDNDPTIDGTADATEYIADTLIPNLRGAIRALSQDMSLTREEVRRLNWLKRYAQRAEFVGERLKHNADNWVVDSGPKRTEVKPLEIAPVLHTLMWQWGGTIVLSSATIQEQDLWEWGFGSDEVEFIDVESTFPVDNRPVILDRHVGKMTQDDRDETIPKMADEIQMLADEHHGEKGIIHCRSYGIADRLTDHMDDDFVANRVLVQDQDRREESLQQWQDGDRQVFMSVSMDEGIDLKYDECRWGVLAKALYKHMGDKRVRERVFTHGDWQWYQRHAAIQIQQAYGRAVRAQDDEATFYVLDTSAVDLIEDNPHMFQDWFLSAVE